MKILDEYANILRGIYSVRLNGRDVESDVSMQAQSVPRGPTPPFINSLEA
jgi:hypothetical protein